MSHATAAPFAGFNLCFVCPYFHKAASAVSSKILRHSVSNSVKENVPTPFQSVPQRLPKLQSVLKNISALKNLRSVNVKETAPASLQSVPQSLPKPRSVQKSVSALKNVQHHHRHHKGVLTFEVNKMLATKSTTDIPKAQKTDKSANNIRNTVKSTTATKKPNGRAYDHNCFFTPMNCKMYLRV